MRILLVMGPSTGGIGRHVHTLARGLLDRGHDVHVCAPAETAATFDWTATGARFVPAPVTGPGSVPGAGSWRTLRAAGSSADIVHAHGTRAGAAAALAGVRPLVTTWHNAPVGAAGARVVHRLVERLSVQRADLVIGASADLVERARRAGARHAAFLPVSAPALPPPERSRDEARHALGVDDRPMVLAVARLARQKRLDLLVEATAGWQDDPRRPLVLVAGSGDDEVRKELEAAATRLRSPVVLLGHRHDIADLLAAADVAVLTSDWEARPLVAQEALRAGVPLVATAVGGIPGLVGDAAELVPAGDAAGVRAALERMLDDTARRQELIAAGVARAADWPTEAATVDAMVAAYLEVRSRVRAAAAH